MRDWLCVLMKAKYRCFWTASDRIYIQLIVYKRTRNHTHTRPRYKSYSSFMWQLQHLHANKSPREKQTSLNLSENALNVWDVGSRSVLHAWRLVEFGLRWNSAPESGRYPVICLLQLRGTVLHFLTNALSRRNHVQLALVYDRIIFDGMLHGQDNLLHADHGCWVTNASLFCQQCDRQVKKKKKRVSYAPQGNIYLIKNTVKRCYC